MQERVLSYITQLLEHEEVSSKSYAVYSIDRIHFGLLEIALQCCGFRYVTDCSLENS